MATEQVEIARLAVARGWISPAQERRLTSAGDFCLAAEWLTPRQFAELQAELSGYALAEWEGWAPVPEVVARIPREIALRYRVCPLREKAGGLVVAISTPSDLHVIDSVQLVVHGPIEFVVATAEEVHAALQRAYQAGGDGPERVVAPAPAPRAEPTIAATTEPVVKWIDALLVTAVRQRASDIHVEPLEHRLRVRLRIDGALVEAATLPREQQAAALSRLKLLANLSIAEKRLPQDGRMRLTYEGRTLDLRVASVPTVHGESLVMRLLDPAGLRRDLTDLGLRPEQQRQLQQLLAGTDGLVVVTGPTGSGKTTTLYSCLHHLNQPDRKIITVEDPVEYQMKGVTQVPVRSEVGMTFAAALRAMLRQSPNVVMVGEIRDRETAEVALNAALTGHLVLSTLHTNDAPGAITRFLDLGLQPFLVAAALRGVVAQRLVRRVCPECARVDDEAAALMPPTEVTELSAQQFRRGVGCPACWGTGFRGRVGLYEILRIGEELQPLIHTRASATAIRRGARALGWRPLRDDGLRKAGAGMTTVHEVLSETVAEAD